MRPFRRTAVLQGVVGLGCFRKAPARDPPPSTQQIESRRIRGTHYEVDLRLRLPVGVTSSVLVQALSSVPDIEILEASDILD